MTRNQLLRTVLNDCSTMPALRAKLLGGYMLTLMAQYYDEVCLDGTTCLWTSICLTEL